MLLLFTALWQTFLVLLGVTGLLAIYVGFLVLCVTWPYAMLSLGAALTVAAVFYANYSHLKGRI